MANHGRIRDALGVGSRIRSACTEPLHVRNSLHDIPHEHFRGNYFPGLGIEWLLSIDRQELFGISLRVQICMSTQHTNNDKTFPLWATLPTKHMPTKATARMNTFFSLVVLPLGAFPLRGGQAPIKTVLKNTCGQYHRM